MRKIFTTFFLLFSCSIVSSQTIIPVIADYIYTGNKKQSTQEVEEEAINHAKIEALSKAGIKEHVKTYSSLYRRTENNEYDKILTSDFFSEKQGAITTYEIMDKSHSYTSEGLPVCYIKINANVIKYKTEADYNYKAFISGLSPVYSYDNKYVKNEKNPELGHAVRFNFTPTKDTYLTIFALWDDEIYLLFPNEKEKKYARRDGSTIFKKNKKYEFGNHPEIWFNAEEKNTGYRLIFVIHKQEIMFHETLNIENMWKWIFEIPRKLRYVTIENFTVYDEK